MLPKSFRNSAAFKQVMGPVQCKEVKLFRLYYFEANVEVQFMGPLF